MERRQADLDGLPLNHAHRRPLEAALGSQRESAAELSRAVGDAPTVPTQVLHGILSDWKARTERQGVEAGNLPHNHVNRRLLEALHRSRSESAAELSAAVNTAAFGDENAEPHPTQPDSAPDRHQLLVELYRSCRTRRGDLRAQADRLWDGYEVLEGLLLSRVRTPDALEVAAVLRDALADLESFSPLPPPESGERVLAAEFYRQLDPGCQADRLEPATDWDAYASALVAMLTACQAMYFVFGQLLLSVNHGVEYLEGPKREILRLQFRLE